MLDVVILVVGLEFIAMEVSGGDETNIAYLFLLIIPAYWFLFAQGAKRCHDRGNTGWFQIIPFYGLWMLFADGEHGMNQYGPNPKGIGNTDEMDEVGDHLV